MLDRGIDDMEAGRELPLEDAFRKITELRNARTNAEFKSIQYCFPRTHFLYRGYSIHKKSFPPSIIFYIIEQRNYSVGSIPRGVLA